MARASKKTSAKASKASKRGAKATTAARKPATRRPAKKKATPKKAPKKAAPAKGSSTKARAGKAGKRKPATKGARATTAAKPARKTAARKAPAVKTTVKKAAPPPRPAPVKPPAPAAKKPPPPPPPPPKKPQKPEVTPKAIEKIKATLEAQRVALLREFTDLEEGAFSLSQSDMSGEASFDEEYADAGSFTFEREKELSIGNNIRDLLEKVDHALDRIRRGTYGLCENCGDPINKDRLLALPYSSLCIRCKQQEERIR